MKKKGIIILTSVVVVCALGLLLSTLVDWPVNMNQSSGNISKSSRFSRKTADETVLNNMQELILNDEAYKNGVVASYVVMQTRAKQFDALVDMSNEVAGGIKEYDGLLKDMNKAKPLIDNVCASLATAGEDLSGAFSGENRPDLAQNTINASLAYTTLQKQNSLADRFIATTDNYLKSNEGSDKLKFVRDQWVDYQRMSAALEGDKKAAEELQNKGYKLNPEQTAATLNEFSVKEAVDIYDSNVLGEAFEINGPLAEAITPEMVRGMVVAGYITGDSDLGNEINIDTNVPLGEFTREVAAHSDIFDKVANSWEKAGFAGGEIETVLGHSDAMKNGPGEIETVLGHSDAMKNGPGEIDQVLGHMTLVGLSPEMMKSFDNFVRSMPATSIETVCFHINDEIIGFATGDGDALSNGLRIWE
ncbi:MAG: hypothetical protein IKI66_11425 [Bacteroidales bacterium]|nr:hypothetical protein [Bacteroidales bacterium]